MFIPTRSCPEGTQCFHHTTGSDSRGSRRLLCPLSTSCPAACLYPITPCSCITSAATLATVVEAEMGEAQEGRLAGDPYLGQWFSKWASELLEPFTGGARLCFFTVGAAHTLLPPLPMDFQACPAAAAVGCARVGGYLVYASLTLSRQRSARRWRHSSAWRQVIWKLSSSFMRWNMLRRRFESKGGCD